MAFELEKYEIDQNGERAPSNGLVDVPVEQVQLPKRRQKGACCNRMVVFFGRIKSVWKANESTAKKLLPAVILLVFSASSAVGFYFIEKSGTCPMKNYWAALFYVGTVHSTIGYGNIAPCTVGGKVATVFYTLISIPLTLTSLDGVGYLLARFSAILWSKIRRFFKNCYRRFKDRRKNKVSPEVIVDRGEQAVSFPFLLSLLLTLQWIFLSALFFALTENWSYFDAMYFVFISITTIGFGDIHPVEYYLAAVQWAFIMIGLALFSMSINVVQENMEDMSKNISNYIAKQYLENLQAGTNMGGGENEPLADDAAIKANIRRMIKKQPGGRYLQFLIGKSAEAKLVEEYKSRADMRVATTQTDVQTVNFGQWYAASVNDQQVQVNSKEGKGLTGVAVMKSISTQINWMPVYHGNRAPHWTEIFASSIKKPAAVIHPPAIKPKPPLSRKPPSVTSSVAYSNKPSSSKGSKNSRSNSLAKKPVRRSKSN